MLCWSLYDAPIYVYVYVYEYANLLNLSSLPNVRKDTFAFYVYVYVATAKGLYQLDYNVPGSGRFSRGRCVCHDVSVCCYIYGFFLNNLHACEALMQFAEPNTDRMSVTVFF